MSTTTTATSVLSPAEQEALKAATFQRLHPRVYLERFLSENVRPDGRPLDGWRDVSANVGTCYVAVEQPTCGTLTGVFFRLDIDCGRLGARASGWHYGRMWGKG